MALRAALVGLKLVQLWEYIPSSLGVQQRHCLRGRCRGADVCMLRCVLVTQVNVAVGTGRCLTSKLRPGQRPRRSGRIFTHSIAFSGNGSQAGFGKHFPAASYSGCRLHG